MSTQHTPTPWIADNVNAPDDAPTAIWMDDGTDTYYHRTSQVAECFFDSSEDALDQPQGRRVEKLESVANAAFIVRACNSHEKLVAALECAEAINRPAGDVSAIHEVLNRHGWNCGASGHSGVEFACSMIRAALAAAKGEA